MYFVYILKSKLKDKYYIGSTNNKSDRLKRHNLKQGIFTKKYAPWEIVYTEKFLSRSGAYKRELQIKSYKGGNAFRKLIDGEVA